MAEIDLKFMKGDKGSVAAMRTTYGKKPGAAKKTARKKKTTKK